MKKSPRAHGPGASNREASRLGDVGPEGPFPGDQPPEHWRTIRRNRWRYINPFCECRYASRRSSAMPEAHDTTQQSAGEPAQDIAETERDQRGGDRLVAHRFRQPPELLLRLAGGLVIHALRLGLRVAERLADHLLRPPRHFARHALNLVAHSDLLWLNRRYVTPNGRRARWLHDQQSVFVGSGGVKASRRAAFGLGHHATERRPCSKATPSRTSRTARGSRIPATTRSRAVPRRRGPIASAAPNRGRKGGAGEAQDISG